MAQKSDDFIIIQYLCIMHTKYILYLGVFYKKYIIYTEIQTIFLLCIIYLVYNTFERIGGIKT
ncbi:hypothetical protein ABE61_03270 [Lysinibacillus sphaericus]|nr:hypothetical protein [Lysinibacillus sphaericus]MBG9477600.1 hypothetical protein [Lysinibacillus sphaericus]MBG9594373.1 hypothetical protein [Lysinibacillus sphaericus]